MDHFRFTRLALNPVVAVLLVVYMAVNAWMQPGIWSLPGIRGPDNTVVGRLCSRLRGDARASRCGTGSPYDVRLDADGRWKVVSNNGSGSESQGSKQVRVSTDYGTTSTGLWSLEIESHWRSVRVFTNDGSQVRLTEPELDSVFSVIETFEPGAFPVGSRAKDLHHDLQVSSRVLWRGLANDATVVLASCWFVACVRRRSLAWWRVPSGHCKACGYDLAGIAVACCPECGVPVRGAAFRHE